MLWIRACHVAALAVGVLLAGCAVQTPSSDPFTGGGRTREAGDRLHRVTLEVICDGRCAITYSIAGRSESLNRDVPIWRRRFDRYPRFSESIRLTATGQVERVRIYVGGDIVDSAERGPADTYVTLSAETAIPLPPGSLPSDTLNLEGNLRSARAGG